MDITTFSNIYFIGIGGIGMSALARWFNANGYQVAGYDRTPTLLTNQIQEEGIAVHFEDDVQAIPEAFRQNPAKTLVVYTPAVPKDHTELNYFQTNEYTIRKRSQVLGALTQNQFTVAVAGTHGKTTTSSMVAHIVKSSGKNCAAFLGGITQNYETNLLLNDPNSPEAPVVVVEADEYDRSFLTLYPDIAIINSVDPDHLDIYGSSDAVRESYNAFVQQIKTGGTLVFKKNLPLNLPDSQSVRALSFSIGDDSVFKATNIRIDHNTFIFNVEGSDISLTDVRLNVPGFHNVENALAAIAATSQLKITPEAIKMAIASYKGVKRRFEYIIKTNYLVYIDDYAHHPAEIEALLRSVRALYPDKKISAVFQPHLFTRTRDFADGFASSLSLADQLFLLDIYPARELPIEGINAQLIFDKVLIREKVLCSKNNLLEHLNKSRVEVLVTIGAGDIDQCVDTIKQFFSSKG